MGESLKKLQAQEHPEWDPRTIEVLQMIPNYYLQYFYYTGKKLEAQQSWPPSRAEEVMAVEKGLLAQYADPALREPRGARNSSGNRSSGEPKVGGAERSISSMKSPRVLSDQPRINTQSGASSPRRFRSGCTEPGLKRNLNRKRGRHSACAGVTT
jgi:hypothetical protein